MVGEPRSSVENRLDPFLACDSAIEGAVFDRIELGFVVRVASDLERIVVALRCRESGEAREPCSGIVLLLSISFYKYKTKEKVGVLTSVSRLVGNHRYQVSCGECGGCAL